MPSAERKIMKRYRDMDLEADRLINGDTTPAQSFDNPPAQPTDAHRQVLALLHDLLALVRGEDAGPFGGMLRMLRRMEPMLLRDFSSVPEAPMVEFIHQLGRRMLAVGTTEAAARDITVPAELASGPEPNLTTGT